MMLQLPFQSIRPAISSFERRCPACTYAAAPPTPLAAPRACCGLTFLPSLLYRTLGGGARLRRPSRERTLCTVRGLCEDSMCRECKRTERSCREWRRRRSTGASGTSLVQRIRRRRRHRRYHLHIIPSAMSMLPHVTASSCMYPSRCDVRIAADSTMLRIVNLLIALSLGVHREQLEHLIGLTWPRPFLLRPLSF